MKKKVSCHQDEIRKLITREREGTEKQIVSEKKNQRKKSCVRVPSKANEPGIYVSGTANGVPISTLIDTRATVTLLSKKVFDILNREGKIALTKIDLNILAATCATLNYIKSLEKHSSNSNL